MPELITETLLVTAPFKDRGVDYLAGDRVPIRHRRIRQIAAEHPEFFRMEYAPEELDLAWLAAIEVEAEEKYKAQKRLVEEQKARQKRNLRHELESQDLPQPELEKRFRKQEAAEKKRKEKLREEREREAVEQQIAIVGDMRSGFNYD